jgi:hypothetical protein
MIKQKLQTIPGATLVGTEITRSGGQMPSVAALPTTQTLPYLTGVSAGSNPLTNGSDTMGLPMFNPTAGNSDSGAHFGAASGGNVIAGGQGQGDAAGHGFTN